MTEIDFLPAEYWNRRSSRRDQRYLLLFGAGIMIVVLANMAYLARTTSNLREQLSSLDIDHADILAQAAEVRRLEPTLTEMATDAELALLVRARPSVSRVLVALATSCPTRMTLSTIRMKPDRAATVGTPVPTVRPAPNSPKAALSPSELQREKVEQFFHERHNAQLTLEVTGLADSLDEVGEFIDRLYQTDCFSEVTLKSGDAKQHGPAELREFVIVCRIKRVLVTL